MNLSGKVWEITIIVLGIIAAMLVVVGLVFFAINDPEVRTSCEDLERQNTKSNYVPLPKRCEKGE